MLEIIDQDTKVKMMALILCGIQYDSKRYVVYCVRREGNDANIFVSKLVQNSQGLVMDHQFENGEKDVIEKIIQRFLSKENSERLKADGILLFRDFELVGMNCFHIENCYVTTVTISLIKQLMIDYGLADERVFEQPVAEFVASKRKFNEGFVSNLVLIILGITLIIFCLGIVYDVFLAK